MTSTALPLRVLVAEDDYLLAMDVASALQRAGALVVGPAATLDEALAIISDPLICDAAVLDISLVGEMVFPAADILADRSIGLVFYSGYDGIVVPERFRDAARVSKACGFGELASAVFDQHQRSLEARQGHHGAIESAVPLVPLLRAEARLLEKSSAAADARVARALERAILLVEQGVLQEPLKDALLTLVRQDEAG